MLSFNALADLAAKHHVSIPYLFPLVVEAGVVIFSLNALYRSIHDEHARWQWLLIIGSSLLAGTFNVLHAEVDLVSRIMAAMPSLFLLLSFESFLNQVKHGVKRSNLVQSLEQLTAELETKRHELDGLAQTKQAEIDRLTKRADTLNGQIEQSQATLSQLHQEIEQAKTAQSGTLEQARQSKAQQDQVSMEQRRARLMDILNSEGDVGASALAERLNISRGTVYNDLQALSVAGRIVRNGHGWEVVG